MSYPVHEFVIEHKVHPYTRTTQAMKFVDPRYHRYRYSQDDLRRYFANIMAVNDWPIMDRKPIQVAMVIHLRTVDHRVDLDNQVKAVLDAAQGIVFPFDGWVDAIYARRRKSNRDRLLMLVGREPVTGYLDDLEIALERADYSWLQSDRG